MTRPMPGPPEDWWYCTPPHGEPGLWTSDMDPAEYMPFTHLQHKRLPDAECMREWGDAAWDRWYAADSPACPPPMTTDSHTFTPLQHDLRARYARVGCVRVMPLRDPLRRGAGPRE